MAVWSYQTPKILTDEQYQRWQSLLEQRTGICFMQHKSILQAGLSKRMREIAIDDFDHYYQQVSAVPEGIAEWMQLVDRISIKETSFFREPDSFQAVRTFLLDRLDAINRVQDRTLDIWSVGCASGEEAYSLAMTASDMVDYTRSSTYIAVVATDISHSALQYARRGSYHERKLAKITPSAKVKYFIEQADNYYQIVPSLREKMCFTQGNILDFEKLPAAKMDIIFCQNVMVYFRRERIGQLMNTLVKHLKPGGLLIVGSGEVSGWRHPWVKRLANELVQAYIRTEND